MGDFQANFRRPKDSGIHTVEGNVAGARAASLVRQREKDQEAYEAQVAATKKQKMATLQTTMKFNAKFSSSGTTTSTTNTAEFAKKNSRNIITTAITEESFLDATVGLVTAEEFKRLQKAKDDFFANDNEQSRALCINSSLKDIQAEKDEMTREKEQKMARKRKVKEERRQMATLSFADSTDNPIEDDNDEVFITNSASTGIATTKSAIATGGVVAPLINKKDPSVNTSFLPDRERERIARETRERLEQEWKEQQQVLQNEPLEIVYSYWDGSGHRRSIQCRKGDTIGMFLEAVRKELANEFRELTSIGSDALIYVKEDLMLPHDLTFYDLIVSKARGKSGPLFHFDVHDDVRLGAIDVRMEKDESHPGKIVQRHWYERNKHIFPASRWEHFDPAKDYGNYTIGGKTVQH